MFKRSQSSPLLNFSLEELTNWSEVSRSVLAKFFLVSAGRTEEGYVARVSPEWFVKSRACKRTCCRTPEDWLAKLVRAVSGSLETAADVGGDEGGEEGRLKSILGGVPLPLGLRGRLHHLVQEFPCTSIWSTPPFDNPEPCWTSSGLSNAKVLRYRANDARIVEALSQVRNLRVVESACVSS